MVRVFQYGLMPPVENAELVHQQIRGAKQYRRSIAEIDCKGRDVMRQVEMADADVLARLADVRTASEALSDAWALIVHQRSEESKRRIAEGLSPRNRAESQEARDLVRELRAKRHQAKLAFSGALKLARKQAHMVHERDVQKDAQNQSKKEAYHRHPDTYWPNKNRERAAQEQASKMPLYDFKNDCEPIDPRFRGYRGDGSISVQITDGGAPLATLFDGTETFIRIVRNVRPALIRPERVIKNGPRAGQMVPAHPARVSQRESRDVRELWMRVGSDGRTPVWAKWPMIMHRPIPPGAVVKNATVTRRRIADRDRWTVEMYCDVPEPAKKVGPAAAVDLRWSRQPTGILAATARGEDGQEFRLELGEALLSQIEKSSEIRSVQDRSMESARAALVNALRSTPLPSTPIQLRDRVTSLAQEGATLSQWRSSGRLARFCRLWSGARYGGDEAAFEALEAWRIQDTHLWRWEASQRSKALGRRKNEARVFAAALARRYATLVLEDLAIADLAEEADPEEEYEPCAPRSQRVQSAPGELRTILLRAVAREGGSVVYVPPRSDSEFGTATETMLADARAGIGQGERRSAKKKAGPARTAGDPSDSDHLGEKPRQRSKRLAKERSDRLEAARKTVDKAAE